MTKKGQKQRFLGYMWEVSDLKVHKMGHQIFFFKKHQKRWDFWSWHFEKVKKNMWVLEPFFKKMMKSQTREMQSTFKKLCDKFLTKILQVDMACFSFTFRSSVKKPLFLKIFLPFLPQEKWVKKFRSDRELSGNGGSFSYRNWMEK